MKNRRQVLHAIAVQLLQFIVMATHSKYFSYSPWLPIDHYVRVHTNDFQYSIPKLELQSKSFSVDCSNAIHNTDRVSDEMYQFNRKHGETHVPHHVISIHENKIIKENLCVVLILYIYIRTYD